MTILCFNRILQTYFCRLFFCSRRVGRGVGGGGVRVWDELCALWQNAQVPSNNCRLHEFFSRFLKTSRKIPLFVSARQNYKTKDFIESQGQLFKNFKILCGIRVTCFATTWQILCNFLERSSFFRGGKEKERVPLFLFFLPPRKKNVCSQSEKDLSTERLAWQETTNVLFRDPCCLGTETRAWIFGWLTEQWSTVLTKHSCKRDQNIGRYCKYVELANHWVAISNIRRYFFVSF